MKTTSTRKRKRRIHRRRYHREQRVRNTIFLLIGFAILVLGGVAAILFLRDGSSASLERPFAMAQKVQVQEERGGITLAKGFARDLCVSAEGTVSHPGITLPEGQEGALFDVEKGEVLYAQGLYDKVYPASITKIMTAILACKYGTLDDTVTVSETALQLEAGSQVCGLQAGDQLSLRQLLQGLVVYSGNDAAAAIAEHIGGSLDGFVEMMNEEAQALGCTGTHFTNPHGLQDENHYTTPYDIYLMLQTALSYDPFVEMMQLSSCTLQPLHADGTTGLIDLLSTDHYLTGEATPPKDVHILGGKTGTTSIAGNCLALLSQNAYGKPYVSIVMGAQTKELLYQQMNLLLENINR